MTRQNRVPEPGNGRGDPQRGLSRRSFFGGAMLAGLALAGSGAMSSAALASPTTGWLAGPETPLRRVRAAQPSPFDPDQWVNKPFALSDVTLDGGVYQRGRDQGLKLARAYPADRILAVFRKTAGLDTKGANPPGGWEEYGPDPEAQRWGPAEYTAGQNKGGAGGLLRGHYAGHFLSMLSMAYACSGEKELKTKVDEVVTGLKECQEALAAQTYKGKPRYSHPGFLSAYGEWQFSALEKYAPTARSGRRTTRCTRS